MDYALFWAVLIAVAVFAYVVLDGFDLGVAMLFAVFKDPEERNHMVNTVAPVWDGNETWLILGGGGLFAVFPLAYAILMPALYVPIIVMLLGLVFRGVAFEFRFKTTRGKFVWDWSFFLGSLAAAFSQGIMLGAVLQGVKVVDRAYAGGWFDWLTPFTLYCGVSVVIGYIALGSTWLIMKTSGALQQRAYRVARPSVILLLLTIAVASISLPMMREDIAERWFTFPASLGFWTLPTILAIVATYLLRSLRKGKEYRPYLLTLLLFFISFCGFSVSVYPNLIPPDITIWEAAAPENSLKFLFVGGIVLVPIILAYTAYSYWVFRGKVETQDGYH